MQSVADSPPGANIADLVPPVPLWAVIDSWVQRCDHPSARIYAKTTLANTLAYIACCVSCGHTVHQPKGALTHATVARTQRIEDIPDKRDADALQARYQDWRRYEKLKYHDRYEIYLRSVEWQALRCAVIERDKCCVVCQAPIDHVHHKTYERIFRESLDDLVGLCRHCHDKVHNREQSA